MSRDPGKARAEASDATRRASPTPPASSVTLIAGYAVACPDEEHEMARAKTVGKWLLLAFVVYAVVKSPAQAADIVHTSFDILAQGVKAIIAFFDTLLKR